MKYGSKLTFMLSFPELAMAPMQIAIIAKRATFAFSDQNSKSPQESRKAAKTGVMVLFITVGLNCFRPSFYNLKRNERVRGHVMNELVLSPKSCLYIATYGLIEWLDKKSGD